MVLFGSLPQLFDIVVSCAYMATALQPWIALIVFVLLITYIPLRSDPGAALGQGLKRRAICSKRFRRPEMPFCAPSPNEGWILAGGEVTFM